MHQQAARLFATIVLASTVSAAGVRGAPRSEGATGAIEGRIIYKADSSRPWRYARYYIKDQSRGHLAEAVVAIRGKGLKRRAAATPSVVRMDQRDFRFAPETIAIVAGDSVRFTNSDSQLHNVRTEAGVQPLNINTPAGGEYTHCFDLAGGISNPARIGCVFHSQMQAWIFVFAHPYFQVTAEDGKFRLQDIPVGDYELDIVHSAGNLRASHRVTVRSGETTVTNITVTPDNLMEQKK